MCVPGVGSSTPLVIKRDGRTVGFDKEKIYNAIMKAMTFGSGIVKEGVARDITDEIYHIAVDKHAGDGVPSAMPISEIETMVFDKLVERGQSLTAKAYEGYRRVREFQRDVVNSTDEPLIDLLAGKSDYWNNENSNKDAVLVTTQRDYMAGIESTDITRRLLLTPDVVQAHDDGILHFHDMDYFGQNAMYNCCLVNLEDMLQNGTVISNVLIEKPHSFATACNIATQIIAQVASSQYGGQSISLTHLAPFVQVSREKIQKNLRRELHEIGLSCSTQQFDKIVEERLADEIKRGVQTIQYQVITLMTTNGWLTGLAVVKPCEPRQRVSTKVG